MPSCSFGRLYHAHVIFVLEALRTGVDLVNVGFLWEEYTDTAPVHAVHEMIEIVIDALCNPDKPRPQGEVILGEIIRQSVPPRVSLAGKRLTILLSNRFWARARTTVTPEAEKHFIEAFTDCVRSVATEAEDRDNTILHDIDSYLTFRRRNIGIRSSFMPGELQLSLPDEVYYHPIIRELKDLIADLVLLDNVSHCRVPVDVC